MAKQEKISLYNLGMEKTLQDLYKSLYNEDDKSLLNERCCLFYPMIGKEFYEKKALIVYGQYVNDWKPAFKLTKDKKQIENIVKKALDYSTVSRGCALDWVNRYWVSQELYRSFFWNITNKLSVERYGRNDKDWNHILAYSNLFKIAPQKGNTLPEEMFKAQLTNTAHLFKEEMSLLQPKNVVLITNLQNWAEPVMKAAGIRFETHKEGYVQATGAYRGSRIIVTQKPFTASHREFLDDIKREMV